MITESPIARALFCQEIVESVFSHLSLNSVISRGKSSRDLRGYLNEVEQRKRRGTLASAARVSKGISEVALSVLWAQLDSFDRLLKILPQYSLHWDMSDEYVCVFSQWLQLTISMQCSSFQFSRLLGFCRGRTF